MRGREDARALAVDILAILDGVRVRDLRAPVLCRLIAVEDSERFVSEWSLEGSGGGFDAGGIRRS